MAEVKHLGVILDGNRRFAKKLMLKPWQGHEWGAKKVQKLLEWCRDLDVKELTVFALSLENFNRPKEEFNFLMKLFRETFDQYIEDPRVVELGIRINVIGRIELLPEDIQERIKTITEKTKNNTEYILNVALAYGGRQEIVDAARSMAKDLESNKLKEEDINEETFGKYLYLNDSPDMIIRTGGDKRTSNFLLWQANYSEWVFLEKTWPEFEKEDLQNAIEEYKNRERRFGR